MINCGRCPCIPGCLDEERCARETEEIKACVKMLALAIEEDILRCFYEEIENVKDKVASLPRLLNN